VRGGVCSNPVWSPWKVAGFPRIFSFGELAAGRLAAAVTPFRERANVTVPITSRVGRNNCSVVKRALPKNKKLIIVKKRD